MSLIPGTRLGVYEVTAQIGEGGMGRVFRARDTKLDRDVAIKILPEAFAHDAERLARFTREAKTLASLNHPNIAHIHGLEESGGITALVMELVEGEDLSQRIARGPIPLDEALPIARQIAEALEAAHEQGIIHRDLKPANIRIRADGTVKVLDFGLAKAMEPGAGSSPSISMSPTLSIHATQAGIILGTAGYMSPEQARGRVVDKRADIWAFGCVLYEMLSGRAAFSGATVSDTLARVIEREPAWDALPEVVPDGVRRLVRRCLRKDPAERVHDIADARIEITETLAAQSPVHDAPVASRTVRLVWSAVAAILAALVISLWLFAPRHETGSSRTGVTQFPINLRDNAGYGAVISPDGSRVAVAECCGGPQLWVYSLDGSEPRRLAGTEGSQLPFWSPDGASIGFFADRQVKRIEAAGGPAVVVCQTGDQAVGGTWSATGVMLFATSSALLQVPASGGSPAQVQLVDGADRREFPQFLPDQRHFLYYARRRTGGSVQVARLDGGAATRLFDAESAAVYAGPSSLLFLRGTALVAQRFNVSTLALEGEAAVVAPDVAPGYLRGVGQFSAANGVLAFVKTRGGSAGQLTWFDRTGRALHSIPQPPGTENINPALSPSGAQVAVNLMDPQTGNWDIWVVDVARGVSSRLTFGPERDADPVWSADGKEIVFASDRGGRFGLYRKTVGDSSPEMPIATIESQPDDVTPSDWTPDGRFVLFTQLGPGRVQAIWAAPVAGDRKPFLLLDDRFSRYGARVSPDGRWLAYISFEAGGPEIYVERFMASGVKKQVSHGGGVHPRWTRNGRELVFWAQPGGVMSAALAFSGEGLTIAEPKSLIATPVFSLIDARPHYDVTRDGERFLLRQPTAQRTGAVTIMMNWADKLKR